jgi:nucleotide-binding universal stress UspA family protein
MNPERILLPLDIRKWPVEVFSVVNGLANHPGVTVILLHVVTLSITAPEKSVHEALGRDAHWHLKRIARECLRPGVAAITRVRFGKPAEEILTEAAASSVDLIVLPSYPPSFWSRVFGPILPRVVERVIREALCGVFLATARSRFNCEKMWGRPGNEIEAGSKQVRGGLEREASRVSQAEEATASTREQHHATA